MKYWVTCSNQFNTKTYIKLMMRGGQFTYTPTPLTCSQTSLGRIRENWSNMQLFYLIMSVRIRTRDLWCWYHIELHTPNHSTQKLDTPTAWSTSAVWNYMCRLYTNPCILRIRTSLALWKDTYRVRVPFICLAICLNCKMPFYVLFKDEDDAFGWLSEK